MLISINWPSLVTSWVVVQKTYSKMHIVLCTNTHYDVADLVNHGMVKNTKTWISWERNITFIRNKKMLNLCFRLHILRSYCFVAEVSFKQWPIKTISANYKPMRVSLWLFCRVTENNCCSQLFVKFIQTQKRYPTSHDKVSILTWRLFAILSKTFFFSWTKLL